MTWSISRIRGLAGLCLVVTVAACATTTTPQPGQLPPLPSAPADLLRGGVRRDQEGWRVAHLEGTPEAIGYQHGTLLGEEIAETIEILKKTLPTETGRSWDFYRDTAQRIFWPRISDELRAELRAMAHALRARGKSLDLWDLVAENAYLEIAGSYIPSLGRLAEPHRAPRMPSNDAPPALPRLVPSAGGAAFAATGAFTASGKVLVGHSAATGYAQGRQWTVLLDVAPSVGHRFVMTTMPGAVASIDDYYIGSQGLIVAGAPIAQLRQFDPIGIPYFVRARRAIQLSDDIDAWIERMGSESNGARAAHFVLASTTHREIVSYEQGLRESKVRRSKSGFFVAGGVAQDSRLSSEETDQIHDPRSALERRQRRLQELLQSAKGRLDLERAKSLLADHGSAPKPGPSEPAPQVLNAPIEASPVLLAQSSGPPDSAMRGILAQAAPQAGTPRESAPAGPAASTVCAHGDADPRPRPEWGDPGHFPTGTIAATVTDSALARELALWAIAGHPCGNAFDAGAFLSAHAEHRWLAGILQDLLPATWIRLSGAAGRID